MASTMPAAVAALPSYRYVAAVPAAPAAPVDAVQPSPPQGLVAPAAPTPAPTPPAQQLIVGGRGYRPIGIADVRPGDIGFEYKRHRKQGKQLLISLGERIQNLGRREFRGDPHMLHAFVVTESEPQAGQLMIADAAAGGAVTYDELGKKIGPVGVGEASMGFSPDDKYTDLHSHTVFLRFRDPRVQAMLVHMARAWCRKDANSFSYPHAIAAPWHRKHIHSHARQRLQHVLECLHGGIRVPKMRVMCSEFVAWVGSAAAISLYCQDNGVPHSSPAALRGLAAGHTGQVFNCDPRAMVPSALHARMVADPSVEVVGYIPAPLGAD